MGSLCRNRIPFFAQDKIDQHGQEKQRQERLQPSVRHPVQGWDGIRGEAERGESERISQPAPRRFTGINQREACNKGAEKNVGAGLCARIKKHQVKRA